jgi:hypothetical protein
VVIGLDHDRQFCLADLALELLEVVVEGAAHYFLLDLDVDPLQQALQMHRPAGARALAGIEEKVVGLLALLEADLAGTTLLLPSRLPLRVTHRQLPRTRLLLPLRRHHRLPHAHLTHEELNPAQLDGLSGLETVPLGLAVEVLLLADDEIGLLLPQRHAVGLLRVGALRTDFAETVVGVVNKIQAEAMGGGGHGPDFELGEELELVLVDGGFLAVGCDDDVGCVGGELP